MKVLIISGTRTIREKLRELIEAQPGFKDVKEAGDTSINLQTIEDFAPDVAVIDLQMPLQVCTEAIRRMLRLKPNLKIIALSMHADRRYLDECLKAGVCGYLLKDCAYEELADAISTVASDRQYVSSSIRVH
jgi:DNA-binding NarL/FixJ family response regulator